MPLLTGFNVSLGEAKVLAEAAAAAFPGYPAPAGWNAVTPAQLGLSATYQDGNYYRGGSSGASAIVLTDESSFIVSFRGTDGPADIARYPELFTGAYIQHFTPLLQALAAYAPNGADVSFTGASLGGGATNLMAGIAATAFDGRYADATFVAFASPNITNAGGILNLGFENDPVYKAIGNYKNYASSLDNLVLAAPEYLAGNYDGRHPFDMYAHTGEDGYGIFDRLTQSVFYDQMNPDSVVIFDAADGIVTDRDLKRSKAGAFYLGEDGDDQIVGRSGHDFIEGFGGDDTLTGGKGNDRIEGGDGDDTFIVAGKDGQFDQIGGGVGTDTIRVVGTADLVLAGFDADAASVEIWQGNGKGIVGSKAADIFDLSGLSSVGGLAFVDAGNGNDVLVGSDYADTLRGGNGNDRLEGGSGDDNLAGGKGNDVFAFGPGFGKDVVTDFIAGPGIGDVIEFASSLFADFAAVLAAATQTGASVMIAYDADNTLTLNKMTLSNLAVNDFFFV